MAAWTEGTCGDIEGIAMTIPTGGSLFSSCSHLDFLLPTSGANDD